MKADVFNFMFGEIEQRHTATGGQGVEYFGVPLGFSQLDEAIGGLRKDTMTLIAARTGMGKTALALSVVYSAVCRGYKVAYISLEMSERMLILRLLSMLTGIAPLDIERGRMSKNQLQIVRDVMDHLMTLPLDIIEKGLSSDMVTDHVGNNYPDTNLLVIDHIGILRDPIADRYTKMTLVSNNVRAVARDLDIPVLALAQLNRQADNRENHMPTPADLRDSGALEEDSEIILFPFRPQYYLMNDPNTPEVQPGEAERNAQIIIAKNRQGAPGMYNVWFYPHSTLWTDKTAPPRLPTPGQPTTVSPKQFVSGNLANMVKARY